LNAITLVFYFSTYRPSLFKHYFVPSDTVRYRGAVSRLDSSQHCSLHRGIQKLVDRWKKCLNELGQYVET